MTEPTKVCLTIAGLDPSGGAGILADIKTFSAFGCFGTAVISSITFQNTSGVFGFVHQSPESVRGQLEPILNDLHVDALKTGMLPSSEVISETARLINENHLKNLVVDPVVRSTSGFDLIDDAVLRVLIELLFPLADLITPNIPEAERISGVDIASRNDIEKAARIMQGTGAANVLIKGGHTPGNRSADDILFMGGEMHIFEGEYIETTATHGTGCTLSAAIAANLSLGNSMVGSVRIAKEFVTEAIRTAPNIGHGHSPINHLARF